MNDPISSVALLSAATTTASGEPMAVVAGQQRTFQAYGTTSAGSGAATIVIEVSDLPTPSANTHWLTLGTITLTLGTTLTTDGFASDAAWRHVRGRVSAISGTNATVTAYMGA